MHQTIAKMQTVVAKGDAVAIALLLAPDVTFLPPTYWKTWTGRDAVAAVLSHVGQVFTEFQYRRVMEEGKDLALEFQCKVGDLDAVGVDLITLWRPTLNLNRRYLARLRLSVDIDDKRCFRLKASLGSKPPVQRFAFRP